MPKKSPLGFDGTSTDATEPVNPSTVANADPTVESTTSPIIVPSADLDTNRIESSSTIQTSPPSRVVTAIPINSPTDCNIAPVATLLVASTLSPTTKPIATPTAKYTAAPIAAPALATPTVVCPAVPSVIVSRSQLNAGSSRVADRIKSLNDLQGAFKASAQVPVHDPASTHHAVSPKMASRALPFARRDAAASPLHLHSPPLGPQSYFPASYVHSPLPNRAQPQLSRTMEKRARYGRPIETSEASAKACEYGPALGQVICPRHGRKLAPRQKTVFTTTEGFERSISGAYLPTGRKIRSQVDALNPWILMAKHMTKKEGTTVSPDICPDCLAEHDILTRELSRPSENIDFSGSPSHDEGECEQREPSSTNTEPGTPTIGLLPHNVLIGVSNDHQTVTVPGTAVSGVGIPIDQVGAIVAADLGEMLDAIIIEHSGTLDKVITNLRDGMPDSARIQQLSKDLARVSEAVGAVPEDQVQHIATFTRDAWPSGKRSMILDASPERIRERTKSIPQLLNLIDATAEHLGLNVASERTKDTPQTHDPSGDATSTAEPAYLDKKLFKRPTLRQPILEVPGGFPVTLDLSSYNIAFSSPMSPPDASRQSTAKAPRTDSPLLFHRQDLGQLDCCPTGSAPDPARTVVDAPAPTPMIRPSPTASRVRLMSGPLPQSRLAPFQMAGEATKRTLVKPSEVAKQQRLQRTFEQDWLRNGSGSAARALATAERSERRGRIVQGD